MVVASDFFTTRYTVFHPLMSYIRIFIVGLLNGREVMFAFLLKKIASSFTYACDENIMPRKIVHKFL